MSHLIAATTKVVELHNELTKITEQRDALFEVLQEMLKYTPRFLSCQDFHHPKKDQHGELDDCQPTKRFREAWGKAEQALKAAAIK